VKDVREAWDFPYDPVGTTVPRGDSGIVDVVVATLARTDVATFAPVLRGLRDLSIRPLFDQSPVHWTRITCAAPASHLDVAALLSRADIGVRYVAPARRSTMTLAPPLDFARAEPCEPTAWAAVGPRDHPEPLPADGRWFVGPNGVRLDRGVCGTGSGTRLAVVEDDTADVHRLELDGVTSIGVEHPASASGHGALIVGWASGAVRADGTRFVGVAPDASVRLYCIPKPGADVVSFPLAVLRAVFDGADVVVCATYLEATASPMLDDALEAAVVLGRGGRGTVVILPTGRETSSPEGSLHASLSLGLGEPASDPRAHCVAPSGREGGWFLWRDARGLLRPFANRGPAVRWLAPGDDLAYPFTTPERLFHAESSGASAVAAGVISLVLARNPLLSLGDLHELLRRTADPPAGGGPADAALADPADLLPAGQDRDGHDAKCGYGRLNATRACASAADPFALTLGAIGEEGLALAWSKRDDLPYTAPLARWVVRALLGRPDLDHAARVVVRHLRLLAATPSRARRHPQGALARQLGIVTRDLARQAPSPNLREELERMTATLGRASAEDGRAGREFERALASLLADLWTTRT
jgi:hypothetical protein